MGKSSSGETQYQGSVQETNHVHTEQSFHKPTLSVNNNNNFSQAILILNLQIM